MMQARLCAEASQTCSPPSCPRCCGLTPAPADCSGGKVNCRNLNNHKNTKQCLPPAFLVFTRCGDNLSPSHSCCVLGFHSEWLQRRRLSNTLTFPAPAADMRRSDPRARGGLWRRSRSEGDRASDQIKTEREQRGGV